MEPHLSEAVRLAHNQAFADHWGSEPRDEESWRFTVNDPLARPDLSAVVLETGTGDVAGYQLASHDPESAATRGFSEGYTELLGVRREFRGRGIAQALLADAMRRFAAAEWTRLHWTWIPKTRRVRWRCISRWGTTPSTGAWPGTRSSEPACRSWLHPPRERPWSQPFNGSVPEAKTVQAAPNQV